MANTPTITLAELCIGRVEPVIRVTAIYDRDVRSFKMSRDHAGTEGERRLDELARRDLRRTAP